MPSLNATLDHIHSLEQHYALIGPPDVIAYALDEVPALYSLLEEALAPLNRAFGEDKTLLLQGLQSEEDTVLRVIALLPAGTPKPEEMMRQFDRDWWYANCARSDASLAFDYGTADAV